MSKDARWLTVGIPGQPGFEINLTPIAVGMLFTKETTGDIASEKKKWITLINGYAHFSNHSFFHTFFGKMTKEQVGQLAYKHTDHHLRQFKS